MQMRHMMRYIFTKEKMKSETRSSEGSRGLVEGSSERVEGPCLQLDSRALSAERRWDDKDAGHRKASPGNVL